MVDVIVERCAGLDVHRDTVVATVRVPGGGKSRRRRLQETRTFGTTIGQLERLSDWLAECEVTRVGMESTGCYWKTLLLRVGGPVRVLARQREAPAQRPRTQERCDRFALVLRAGRAGSAAAELRPTPGDPPAARPDPAPVDPGAGAHAGRPEPG